PILRLFTSSRPPDPRTLHSSPTRRSSDLELGELVTQFTQPPDQHFPHPSSGLLYGRCQRHLDRIHLPQHPGHLGPQGGRCRSAQDRKSTRLNSSHQIISYAVFCLKKKNNN